MSAECPNFYVVKKYNHGWLLRDPKNNTVLFLTNEQLAQRGFISYETKPSKPPSSAPKVIIVPTRLRRSLSARRADTDPDWRARPQLSQSAPPIISLNDYKTP